MSFRVFSYLRTFLLQQCCDDALPYIHSSLTSRQPESLRRKDREYGTSSHAARRRILPLHWRHMIKTARQRCEPDTHRSPNPIHFSSATSSSRPCKLETPRSLFTTCSDHPEAFCLRADKTPPAAHQLITIRRATVVSGSDADTFFCALNLKLETIQESRQSNPSGIELTIAMAIPTSSQPYETPPQRSARGWPHEWFRLSASG
jgi:hypothetical protein